jgi:hypothetical protein
MNFVDNPKRSYWHIAFTCAREAFAFILLLPSFALLAIEIALAAYGAWSFWRVFWHLTKNSF